MSTAFSLQIFGVGNKLMKDAVLDLSTPGSRVIWPASIPAKVTDVSISGPFTVSPAPTPGNPLVTIGLANVPTGTVWMGPASGAQGPPTFRKIQASDLASIGGAFQPTSASLTQISAGTWPGDVSITTLGTITTGIWHGSVVGPVYGGTGISSYILGDTLYASAPNVLSKLAGNTTLVRQFLRQVGTGAVSAAPAWDTVTCADVGAIPYVVGTAIAAVNLGSGRFLHIRADGMAIYADASAGLEAHCYTDQAVTAGNPVNLSVGPVMGGLAGLTVGSTYWLSDSTPGLYTDTPPASGLVQRLGFASQTNTLIIEIIPALVAI